jgi:hypothetical protein
MTSLRQFASAALIGAAVTFGWAGFGAVATSSAEQREWDIESFDNCMRAKKDDPSEQIAWNRKCCVDSGGEWNPAMGKCQAAPASASATRWPWRIPVGVFAQDLTPAP